jgi:hypothetical protein
MITTQQAIKNTVFQIKSPNYLTTIDLPSMRLSWDKSKGK